MSRDLGPREVLCLPSTATPGVAGVYVAWRVVVGRTRVQIRPPEGRAGTRLAAGGVHECSVRDVIGHEEFARRQRRGELPVVTDEDLASYINRGLRVRLSDIQFDDDGLFAEEREVVLTAARQAHLLSGGCPGCPGQVGGPHKMSCSVR